MPPATTVTGKNAYELLFDCQRQAFAVAVELGGVHALDRGDAGLVLAAELVFPRFLGGHFT